MGQPESVFACDTTNRDADAQQQNDDKREKHPAKNGSRQSGALHGEQGAGCGNAASIGQSPGAGHLAATRISPQFNYHHQ
jgi:hypothetical protein